MKNEKLADKVLTDSQMESVAGGTRLECKELARALRDNHAFGVNPKMTYEEIPYKKHLAKLGISINYDEGSRFTTGDANVYSGPIDPDWKSKPGAHQLDFLSHEEVLRRIRAYKG